VQFDRDTPIKIHEVITITLAKQKEENKEKKMAALQEHQQKHWEEEHTAWEFKWQVH
jgi:hypothetical protein